MRINLPIGTGTRKHLVNTKNVEGVDTNTNVEGLTSTSLGEVLVGTDTGRLKRLGGDLLKLK